MKRIISLIALSCFTMLGHGQKFGTSGYGDLNSGTEISQMRYAKISSFCVTLSWKEFEPSEENYDYDYVRDKFKRIKDSGLNITYIMQCSPYDANTPAWLNTNKGMPIVTTNNVGLNRFPYYLFPAYKTAYYKMIRVLANYIKNDLDADIRIKVVSGLHGVGSTGDVAEPYKGVPLNNAYVISPSAWTAYVLTAWDSINTNYSGLSNYKSRFNPGNDAEYFNLLPAGSWYKQGFLTHDISFNGEVSFLNRWKIFSTDPENDRRSESEVQQVWSTPYWLYAPVKNSMELMYSSLAGGLDKILLPGGWRNQNITDPRPTDFFVQFAGLRNPYQVNKGFIRLCDKIDFADTIRFPVSTFGQLINPDAAVKRRYERKIAGINSQTTSEENKDWQRWQAVADYINPARVTAIRNANPRANYPNDPQDFYHNDFIIGGIKNYERFIYQVDPDNTSEGGYRVGPDSSAYGRWTRHPNLKYNIGEMKFKLDENLKNSVRKATVKILVRYWDNGTGAFAVNCYKCNKVRVGNPVYKSNTNTWKTAIFTLPNATLGRKMDGVADIGIAYVSGDNTEFDYLQVELQ